MRSLEILRNATAARATVLIALLAVGCLLYFAQVAFIPVAIALFLSSLLTPAVDLLQRWHLPRGLGAILVVALVLFAGVAGIDAVWNPAKVWFDQAPQTMERIELRVRPVQRFLGKFDVVTQKAGQLTRVVPAKGAKVTAIAPAGGGGMALALTESVLEGLTIIPLTLFFLIGGPPLLARMGAALSGGDSSGGAVGLTMAIRSEVGRYFGTIALINLGLGAATAACVAALGMPNPILWGVLAGVLNFVPYLGPIATIVILGAAALVTFDQLGRALAVPGVFVVLHLLESQVVEPLTVGRRLELNALVILLAVWFGYWFWGVAGVLMAVPSLVALKVAAEHKPSWPRVLDFLAPNEKWTPRSLEQLRRLGRRDAKVRGAAESPPSSTGATSRTGVSE
ncbi:MAG: AI-2E family transporter [Steroidobacteraceae bacterium]